jgi:hypothetical protein
VVDVKNKEPEQILEHNLRLRGSAGRKTSHRVRKRHITQQPSVQVRLQANFLALTIRASAFTRWFKSACVGMHLSASAVRCSPT